MVALEKLIIRQELVQRREEGCDTKDIHERIEAALADNTAAASEIDALYSELDALEPEETFPYTEPSTLEAIRALRPEGPRSIDVGLSDDDVLDRIYGAWLGRAAGCSLGKPVEGWPRSRIDSYLESTNALPLDNYLPYVEKKIPPGLRSSTRGNIEYMARDDDMDYPILGLLALESKGAEFTARNMANMWLSRMPYHLLYTAESAAYRNFVNRRWPPESATYRNPHREWIGAQIRADMFGYVTPGWPEKAAELAFRDASISHVKNGIYGEMFVAAMISAAFVRTDTKEIVEIGLSEIPANCRLAEAVRDTVAWCRAQSDWELVWDRINQRYGHYHGVHTINNAALVVMGLLFGDSNYENGIVVTVRGGWDTDCNGATVGSILGAKFGACALPEKWIGVLNDRLLSSVRDCNDNKISDLAARTHEIAKKLAEMKACDVVDVTATVGDVTATVAEVNSNLPGSWTLNVSWGMYILRVNPDLTGSLEEETTGEIYKLSNVSSEGDAVSFSYAIDKGGWEVEITFEGSIIGDAIKGDFFTNVGDFAVSGVRN